MEDLDDLIEKHKKRSHIEDPVIRPPQGWTPGVRVGEGGVGEAIIQLHPGEEPQWDAFLEDMGFGDVLQFVRVVDVRSWEVFSKDAHGKGQPGKIKLRYVKCKVVRRMQAADKQDMDFLKEEILRFDPPTVSTRTLGTQPGGWLMGFLADWQLGKREGGGTRETVERIKKCLLALARYAVDLRKLGVKLEGLILCGMGDIVEACDGHYAMQTHGTDLHMREQRAVARRLLIMAAKILRPYFDVIIFRAIPGNHGEERKDGKAYTHFSDNNDVCIFDQFADVMKEASWADGIQVHTTSMTEPELTMTFEVGDNMGNKKAIGLAHGHQARGGGGDPASRVKGWWEKCAMSRHPIGYVDILNTGHFHHFRVEDRGEGRTWFQCPTLDGGSFWYWAQGGNGSVPGMLCYVVTPSTERGWDHPRVLTP